MLLKRRVILIDRDEKFMDMIKYMLSHMEKIVVINTYSECSDALKNLDRDAPDIIIMDIDFKSLKGPDFITRVKKLNQRIDILVFTDHTDEDVILNIIGCGASGFLLKQNNIAQLPEAVNDLAKGGSPLNPLVARIILNAQQGGASTPLTSKETLVLKLMMNGMTYTMIADELGIAKETSKTHIKNIYKKLDVNSRAQAVSKAITEKLVPVNMMYNYVH